MPYAIPAGGILEIRLRSLLFQQVVMNVFHYRLLTTVEDGYAALLSAANDFNDVVWSSIHPGIAAVVETVKIDAQWIKPIRYRARTIDATPAQGSNGGVTNQTGTAAVIKRYGEEANRKNQGRVFIYGVPTVYQEEGRWAAGFLAGPAADMLLAVKAQIQIDIDHQLVPIVYSPTTEGFGAQVQGSDLNPVIRYQRRREVGVGQ